jgi:hypothetical protein
VFALVSGGERERERGWRKDDPGGVEDADKAGKDVLARSCGGDI